MAQKTTKSTKKTTKTSPKNSVTKSAIKPKTETGLKPEVKSKPVKSSTKAHAASSKKVMDITPVKKSPKTPRKKPNVAEDAYNAVFEDAKREAKAEKIIERAEVPEEIEVVELDNNFTVKDYTIDGADEIPAEEYTSEEGTEAKSKTIAEIAAENEPYNIEEETEEDLEETLDNFAAAPNVQAICSEVTSQEKALADLENDGTKPENAPKPRRKLRLLPKLLALISLGTLGYLVYLIVIANVLPVLHLSLIIGGVALYSLFSLFKNFRRKTSAPVIIILAVFNIIISAVSIFAILKINDTLNFFKRTLDQPTTEVSIYNVIVKKSSPKSSLADISGQVIYAQRDLTLDGNILTDTVSSQAKATIVYVNSLDQLIGLTTSEQVSSGEFSMFDTSDPNVLIHSGTYDDIISENSSFSDKTKVIGQIKVETNVERAEIDDITKKPFMIYLSGIDTRTGTLPERSLSDVNIVAVVNPATRQLLLITVPRDYYVHLAGTPANALPDKLTHAGSTGGVKLSMVTLSELFDINIEQYARVNFNFVENLVDAIDGINIYNDQNYNISCWTDRSCIFKPGYNYVYGACALAFARERHAYETGDRHRGENQQQVIKLILEKVTSSSTLISRYSNILESLVGTFETSLTQENITDLVKMHISDMTPWTVESYSLNGTTAMAPTYSYPAQNLSIMYPDEESIKIAKHKINVALGLETEEKTEEETSAQSEAPAVQKEQE